MTRLTAILSLLADTQASRLYWRTQYEHAKQDIEHDLRRNLELQDEVSALKAQLDTQRRDHLRKLSTVRATVLEVATRYGGRKATAEAIDAVLKPKGKR